MHARSHVDIHADVDVLKLGVDQGVHDACSAADSDAHAGLEAAGRHRHALPDFERSLLAVADAHLRILDDLRVVVGKDSVSPARRAA